MTHEGSATPTPTHAATSGSVWPVAALFGATTAASAALGAWLAAPLGGAARPWSVIDWVAEHALWGTLLGGLLALVLRLGARLDRQLDQEARRRAAAARLAALCVALALFTLAGALAGPRAALWERALPALGGAALGLALAWTLLGRWLAGGSRFQVLPHLDPARVAALIALLTLPLYQGVRHAPDAATQAALLSSPAGAHEPPASLLDAWQVMLGG